MTQNLPAIATVKNCSVFMNADSFELGQRMAKALAASKLIPVHYQGNLSDCMIALELAQRLGASPMAVMQNTFVIHGKPGFSAQFVIAMINSCGRYSPLRFEMDNNDDPKSCYAWAYELSTSERLTGPPVSIKMAKAEGWVEKKGSKWVTMPDLMLRYRAAAFFGRMYAPELMMGMRTVDEIKDSPRDDVTIDVVESVSDDLNKRFAEKKKPVLIEAEVEEITPGEAPPEPEIIDNEYFEKEIAKINTITNAVDVDKWRYNNYERLARETNGPTVTAIQNFLADFYLVLQRDTAEV